MKDLTARQREVLQLISEKITSDGYPPTVREIAGSLKVAVRAAQDHLQALERKGYIERRSRASRSIRVIKGAPAGIPILGRIAAGRPVEAIENLEGYLNLGRETFGGGEIFALRVHGESMIGDHIQDGDFAIVRKQPQVEGTEIAAVAVDGEVTLKRLVHRGEKIELLASNPRVEPMIVQADQVRVFGKLVGVVRRSGAI